MKLIKIDETLIEVPDYNYTELIALHKKAFGTYDPYADLKVLSDNRQKYFDYLKILLVMGKYPNIPTFKSTL